MALPPEQINIKRRREEEPPETLYIQSQLHQTKRRFTDFVFQRVQIRSDGSQVTTTGGDSPSASPLSTAQRAIRSPRSVSNLNVSRHRPAASAGSGVPLVRATSPGAEFREEKRLAAVRKEMEEKMKRALESGPTPTSTTTSSATATATTTAPAPATTSEGAPAPASPRPKSSAGHGERESANSTGRNTPESATSTTTPGRTSSLRRFQISRSSTPNLLRSTTSGGVQKRREGGPVAVLVEKLRRTPHSRQASLVADAALRGDDLSSLKPDATATPSRPRKRPVVNKAERKWREDRKTAISAAKEHISETLERQAQTQHQSNWDDESERLAKEFEQIALELEGAMMDEGEDGGPGSAPAPTDFTTSAPPQAAAVTAPKPALKYPPRTPNKHRAGVASVGGAGAGATLEQEDESDDGEYVYDTYIRRPLADDGSMPWGMNVDLAQDHEAWLRQNGVDTTRKDIGLIVITEEDEEYWEHFVVDDEDDEDRWDSEDGDSNAENNPANEYPDEDLSWDDEDDDPMAAYSRYRDRAVSDDEEFDLADSGSERGYGNGYGYGRGMRDDSDDESW